MIWFELALSVLVTLTATLTYFKGEKSWVKLFIIVLLITVGVRSGDPAMHHIFG